MRKPIRIKPELPWRRRQRASRLARAAVELIRPPFSWLTANEIEAQVAAVSEPGPRAK